MKKILIVVASLLMMVEARISPAAITSQAFQTIALQNQTAPGAPAGAVFNGFGAVAVSDSGIVTFRAYAKGGGLAFNTPGVWIGMPGALQLVARGNTPAPGTQNGINFSDFSPNSAVTDSGQIAFYGWLAGNPVNATNGHGIWTGTSAGAQLVAWESTAAAGMPSGVKYGLLHQFVSINNSGQVVFSGQLTGTGVVPSVNDYAVWTGSPSAPSVLFRDGSQAAGTEVGVVFHEAARNEPWSKINASGAVAFKSALSGPGLTNLNDAGIWLGTPGNLQLVAREGNTAPGTGGANFLELLSFPELDLNTAGAVAFCASVIGTNINSTNDVGIWTGLPGSLQLAAREGSQAPGLAASVLFREMLTDPILNAKGQLLFQTSLMGPNIGAQNDTALWLGTPGALRAFAREGDHAQGTPSGTLFAEFLDTTMNSDGQAAFTASLTGSGVTGSNLHGLWAMDQAGDLKLVIREGDLFDVGNGDFRTIKSIALLPYFQFVSGGDDGRFHSFSSSGRLAFDLQFTDSSSGIFMAIVPEADGFTLAAIGLIAGLGLAARSRSRGARSNPTYGPTRSRRLSPKVVAETS